MQVRRGLRKTYMRDKLSSHATGISGKTLGTLKTLETIKTIETLETHSKNPRNSGKYSKTLELETPLKPLKTLDNP